MPRSPLNENRIPKTFEEMVKLYGPVVRHLTKGEDDLYWDTWTYIWGHNILQRFEPGKGSFRQFLSTCAYRFIRGEKRVPKGLDIVDGFDLTTIADDRMEGQIEARSELQEYVQQVAEVRPEWLKLHADDVPPTYARRIHAGLTNGLPLEPHRPTVAWYYSVTKAA